MAARQSRRTLALALPALLALATACGTAPSPATWEEVPLNTDAGFRGIWFADSLNGWIAGGGVFIEGGIVGRTRDGGRTWTMQSGIVPGPSQTFALQGVQFHDTSRGCMVASGGLVLLTSDGGEHWRSVRHGRSNSDALVDVQFLDERNGWAIGPASIVRTRDGGETWGALLYSSDDNGYLSGNALHMVDEHNGWLAGRSGALMRTSDGGVTWTNVPLPLQPNERPTFWDVTFVGWKHGWVVGEAGWLFHTNDGGRTWERQANGVPVERVPARGERPRPRDVVPELEMPPDRLTLMSVAFADDSLGFAVGYYADMAESVILGTLDGGATWRTERVVPGEELRAVFVLDRRHAWAVGDRVRTGTQVLLRLTGAPDPSRAR